MERQAEVRGRRSDSVELLVNFGLYQAGWFAVVLGAAWGYPWLGAALGLLTVGAHVLLVENRRLESERIAAFLLVGLVVEGLNAAFGVYEAVSGVVAEGVFAPWLLVLWAGFAITFHRSLRWLSGRLRLAFVLGAAAGPLAFWAGERLQAITLTRDPARLALLSALWAVALPAMVFISDRLAARRRSPPRPHSAGVAAATLAVVLLSPALATAGTPTSMVAKRLDSASNCVRAGVKPLVYRGTAAYEHFGFIDVMEAALYDDPATRKLSIVGPVPKCLVIRYERDFDAEDFAGITLEGIGDNVSAKELKRLRAKIDRFNALYRDVKKGDRYSLTFIPGVGTTLSYNGTPRGTVEGNTFAKALFSIWLGDNPMDKDFRRQIMKLRR